jgi:alpha/beta superfamily hydrolase
LGGQCRDPVVAAVFRRLLKISGAPTATVARFNARGVGLSESFPAGTSFLAQAAGTLALTPSQRNERDAGDLVDVVAHALAEASRAAAAANHRRRRRRRLWLIGYSHGSLVASRALPLLRERLPSIDPEAEMAGVIAIAPPLGLICSVFLAASAAFGPFAAAGGGDGDGNDGLARLALLGTRDNFTSVAQLRAALQGFEFEQGGGEEGGQGAEARRRAPARALLLDEADHFFFGRAGEVAEAAVAFVAEVEEEEARRRENTEG